MAGGGSTISSSEPRLGSLQVQTSMYGLAIALVWGRARVSGNLLWFDDFKAIPHTEVTESGGKGGGGVRQERTSYTYEAAVAMAICAGPINGVPRAWKAKQRVVGANVSGGTRTLTYTVTVPVGGVVTVPSAANFSGAVAVRDPNYTEPGRESTGA